MYRNGASERDYDEITFTNGIYRLQLQADSRDQFHVGLYTARQELELLGGGSPTPVPVNPEPPRSPVPQRDKRPRPDAPPAVPFPSSKSCLLLLRDDCIPLEFSAHSLLYGIHLFFDIYKIYRFTHPTSSRDFQL